MSDNLSITSTAIVVIIALFILIVLLWRYFDLEEITPTPPFVKFKRKATPAAGNTNRAAGQSGGVNVSGGTVNVSGDLVGGDKTVIVEPPLPSVNIKGNRLIGNNKIGVKRSDVNIEDNDLLGKNEIDVDDPTSRKKSDKGKRNP